MNNTPNETTLKPCPFCGSEEIDLSSSRSLQISSISCGTCFVRFSNMPEEDLVDAWNARTQLTNATQDSVIVPLGYHHMKYDDGISTSWTQDVREMGDDKCVVTLTHEGHEGPNYSPMKKYSFALKCLKRTPISNDATVDAIEVAARAMYATDPNVHRERKYNTAGGTDIVDEAYTWEESQADEHMKNYCDTLIEKAQAALSAAYPALVKERDELKYEIGELHRLIDELLNTKEGA